MNPTISHTYLLLQMIFFVVLGLPVIYMFIFSFAGLFYRKNNYPDQPAIRKIAVLIPGYKEDEVILETAQNALQQEYPAGSYKVIVIADSFRKDTLDALRSLPVRVIEVQFEKSTKAKALNKAMDALDDTWEIAVVLDADNLMAPDFLNKINAAFENDFVAIQGHRTAKNLDTSLAVLDAISEEINNHIFRKGHRVLGLSSALIGSGMAFSYPFFKKIMSSVSAVGGFDKEIELEILRDHGTIVYLDDARVFDEKVRKEETFSNQRRRWLSAQVKYFRKDLFRSFNALIRDGNIDYFDKVIQFVQPPRILLLGAVLFSGMLFFILNLLLNVPSIFNLLWLGSGSACILSFLFSVPRSFYNQKTFIALATIPKGMRLMLGSLMKIRGADQQFLHTKHDAVGLLQENSKQ